MIYFIKNHTGLVPAVNKVFRVLQFLHLRNFEMERYA